MTATRVWCAIVGILIAAGACERTTSVGAVGRHLDAGTDGTISDGASVVDADAAMAGAAELCTSSGGAITTANCCANAPSFPDMCAIGVCGCSPASSVTTMICECPAGCYSPGVGCVARASQAGFAK